MFFGLYEVVSSSLWVFVKHFWIGNLFYQWVWLQFCISLLAHVTYVLQPGYLTIRSAVHVRGKPQQHTISPIGFAIIVSHFIKFQSAKILWHNTSYTCCFVSHSKIGKTMRLSEFANWTTGPWTFNRSPHGLNMHLVKLYWTQPTSPANCWVFSLGVPPKCQENSGSRFSFIGTTSRLCHGLQRFRKTSCCQPSKTTQWWTTFICCIVQLRWGWETFGAPAAMLRISGASDTDPGLIEG